jgi:toxin ParE1/3/4
VKPVQFSAAAQLDLLEIGDYIARDNPDRAVSFVDEIAARCRTLSEFPRKGRLHRSLRREARILAYRGYLIVYREHEDRVTIERVWHGARDILSLLQELNDQN